MDYATASRHPRLIVTYNTPPATPTNLSPASGTVSASNTPTLSGRFSDPDGGTGRLEFVVRRSSDNVLVASGNGSTVSSGSNSTWTVPAGNLLDGVQYKWRARANDGVDTFAWTSYLNYKVNAPPTVLNLSPATGTFSTELAPTLSGTYSDADGYTHAKLATLSAAGRQVGVKRVPGGDAQRGRPPLLTGDGLLCRQEVAERRAGSTG